MDINTVCLAIFEALNSRGNLTTDEIAAILREQWPDLSERLLDQALTRMRKQGIITRQNQISPWTVTAKGEDAIAQLVARRQAPFTAPYAVFTPVEAEYELLSPSLGPVTGPGGEGKAVWPRLPDGRIIVYGGWIRAALAKALDRTEAVVVGLDGQPRRIPQAVWDHVTISPIILPRETPTIERIRRPVNTRDMAVGEIVHEALPEGTVLVVRGVFPLSHFPLPVLVRMFEVAGEVGISPAGSGRGGIWGLARLLRLQVGDRVVIGEEVPVVAPNGSVTD